MARVGADLLQQNAETLQNGRPATPQPSCTLALRLPKG
jgi:hypothetical protein